MIVLFSKAMLVVDWSKMVIYCWFLVFYIHFVYSVLDADCTMHIAKSWVDLNTSCSATRVTGQKIVSSAE